MRPGPKHLIVLAMLAAVACGGGGYNSPTGPGNTGNPGNPGNPGGTTSPTATNQVTVDNNLFTPSSIQVAAGTTVTWTWAQDAITHNVTFTDGTSSGDKGAGSTFTRTFGTTGTFNYSCTIHPGMSGSVLVK